MGEVLKYGRGFTLKVNFLGGKKSLCTGMGGGRNHCAQCSYESEPQTRAGPPPSLLLFHQIFYINFKHQLLSIFYARTLSDHFLKTKIHDRSAYTFGAVTDFWKFPIKGF